MSEFLATLLVVYAAVSRFRSSVIPRVWAARDPRYRGLLSAILMLDKVLNEQLEFASRGGDA